MSTHNQCFKQKFEKHQNFYLKIFIFLAVKFSVHLNRLVFVMLCVSAFICGVSFIIIYSSSLLLCVPRDDCAS